MGANKQFVITCYRAALRVARLIDCELARSPHWLAVRAPLVVDPHAPQHSWSQPEQEYRLDTLRELLPGMIKMPRSAAFKRRELKRLIRDNYVCGTTASGAELDRLLDLAVAALRVLMQQLQLHRCSSITTMHGCKVECTTAFDCATSDGHQYIYRCRIENVGQEKMQLVGRRLIFKDEKGSTVREVPRGSPGVVGCTPTLRPRDCFQYHSWVNIPGRVGSMRGAYQMTTRPHQCGVQPRVFDAVIAPCRLLADPS